MKYQMNNEVLLAESVTGETRHSMNDDKASIYQVAGYIFNSINRVYKFIYNSIRYIVQNYSSDISQANEMSEFDKYKHTYHGHLPYRIWSRHSALFEELEGRSSTIKISK